MAFDERARIELGQRLAEVLGTELSGYLMEALPPFSWYEVATKSDLVGLEERLSFRLENQLESRLARAETRIIKWTVGAVFGGIAAIGAAVAGIAALVG